LIKIGEIYYNRANGLADSKGGLLYT